MSIQDDCQLVTSISQKWGKAGKPYGEPQNLKIFSRKMILDQTTSMNFIKKIEEKFKYITCSFNQMFHK